ncbi:MAG TPA: hypothetical protein VM076_08345 [Gemmatimonadaceae bacterium]|nr:hypothetical protein [Gemmatimonadaceae bacterium]
MPFFKKSIFTSECDRCHARFHIGAGGVCEQCRKILCDAHLHGSVVRRIQVSVFGAPIVCVKCRAKAARSGASAGTPS